MKIHYLVIAENIEDGWDLEHPSCHLINGPVKMHDCAIERILFDSGMDEDIDLDRLAPGRYPVDYFSHYRGEDYGGTVWFACPKCGTEAVHLYDTDTRIILDCTRKDGCGLEWSVYFRVIPVKEDHGL